MSTGRPYRSSLREERALETRRRIRSSARDLFAAQGFTATTIAEVAEAAGVAPQTVYAVFGSKAGIVVAMIEELEEAVDLATWVERLIAAESPRQRLRIFAAWMRTFVESGSSILRAALAARDDPDVAAMARAGDSNRRNGISQLMAMIAEGGALREGLDHEEAVERMWLITSIELYFQAVDFLGWPPDQYEQWLADTLAWEILGEPAS